MQERSLCAELKVLSCNAKLPFVQQALIIYLQYIFLGLEQFVGRMQDFRFYPVALSNR